MDKKSKIIRKATKRVKSRKGQLANLKQNKGN